MEAVEGFDYWWATVKDNYAERDELAANAAWYAAKVEVGKLEDKIKSLEAQLKVARHLQNVCEMLAVLPPIDPNKLEEEEK